MKRIISCLLFVICASVSFAEYTDGYITAGEYEYLVDWTSHTPPLIVDGGGAEWIELRGFGRIEVISTSAPLGIDIGGIMNILLDDYSQLLYLNGLTEEILIYDNATALLKGGRIDYITSMQIVGGSPHIDLYCRPGWSWLYTSSEIKGISGLWADSTAFNIEFFDRTSSGYDPVWENINIIEIPEPATLALLGIGAVLIRRKK